MKDKSQKKWTTKTQFSHGKNDIDNLLLPIPHLRQNCINY